MVVQGLEVNEESPEPSSRGVPGRLFLPPPPPLLPPTNCSPSKCYAVKLAGCCCEVRFWFKLAIIQAQITLDSIEIEGKRSKNRAKLVVESTTMSVVPIE